MKKTVFIKNALILTATSLILRFAGIIFKVWLAALIGSEGIGLYQLIFSVYVLVSTFATSGISTAVTRLVAEEIALGNKNGAEKVFKRAIQLTLFLALITVGIVYFGAEFIAKNILGDLRAAESLKVLPLSLPFMGMSSCLRGYFIARRKVTPNAVTQLFEQALRIGLIFVLVKKFIVNGISAACKGVMLGDVISETASCLILYAVFLNDRKKLNFNSENNQKRPITKRILHISVPITSGRYLNSLLRTGENILVPKSLAKYPFATDNALSQFGMIKGMALPILFFPSAILNSVSTLLIPEISEAVTKKQTNIVETATHNILKLTAVISFIAGAIFFVSGEEIGWLFYKEKDVGFLIKALSPIVPLMYIDSISDGILKGLDQQVFSFRTAVSDSAIRIVLIITVLPLFGMKGFIGIMYFSNFLTCFLNVGRLLKVSKAKLKIGTEILIPLCLSVIICILIKALLLMLPIKSILVYIIFLSLISFALYSAAIFIFGVVKPDEVKNVIK